MVIILRLLYRVNLTWRWYRVKKAGADLQKYMDDFFSNLPPRKSEPCGECKYSEVSKNNGNLLCLNEKSRHFGEAISSEKDMGGFCHFEREDKDANGISGTF